MLNILSPNGLVTVLRSADQIDTREFNDLPETATVTQLTGYGIRYRRLDMTPPYPQSDNRQFVSRFIVNLNWKPARQH